MPAFPQHIRYGVGKDHRRHEGFESALFFHLDEMDSEPLPVQMQPELQQIMVLGAKSVGMNGPGFDDAHVAWTDIENLVLDLEPALAPDHKKEFQRFMFTEL